MDTFPRLEMCPGGRRSPGPGRTAGAAAPLPLIGPAGHSERRDPHASTDHDGTAYVRESN
jgi:hypothetical protein